MTGERPLRLLKEENRLLSFPDLSLAPPGPWWALPVAAFAIGGIALHLMRTPHSSRLGRRIRRYNPFRRRKELLHFLQRERYLKNALQTVAYINQLLVTETDLDALLQKACERLARHSHYRIAWIGFVEGDRCIMRYRSGDATAQAGRDLIISVNPESEYSRGPGGRAILENRTVILSSTETDPSYAPWRERARAQGIHALAVFPLRARSDLAPFGVLTVATPREEGFDRQEVPMLEELAGDIGFAIHSFHVRERVQTLEAEKMQAQEQLIETLARFIEQRDAYTAGHQDRVARYCAEIARTMGYSPAEIDLLVRSARLHDIGKVSIPDSILLKPARLTQSEYKLIAMHVSTGYGMLSRASLYRDVAEIMRHHHERYDGSGYPDHLEKDAVPPLSRIMIVADSYDAMTTNRIYRPGKPREAALKEIRDLSGIWYDPAVVDAAITALQELPLDVAASQDPSTTMELERFAYFYRDQLTGLYNERYLHSLIESGNTPEGRSACFFGLRNFHAFNRTHSWQEGDRLLARFAAWLSNTFPDAFLFRVQGDDFVALLMPGTPLPDESIPNALFAGTGITVEIVPDLPWRMK